ncbi:MAG: XdhC family protein [Suipraeoptans sp.]
MKEFFKSLKEELLTNKEAILVTIIDFKGSTPREKGAKMWVSKLSGHQGTIGGGRMEYLAVNRALELLDSKSSEIRSYDLGISEAAETGMVCGGSVKLSFYYMDDSTGNIKVIDQILKRIEDVRDTDLIISMPRDASWTMKVFNSEDIKGSSGIESFMFHEKLISSECVYIFGGGHVSREVVSLLSNVDFTCVVFDDREEFSNPKDFPAAKKVILGDFENIDNYINIGENDYVISMTRGHQYDLEVQAWALAKHISYIGIMGSRKKIAFVSKELRQRGFTQDEIDRCYTPIGLEIRAETPTEIAVSIAAELIKIRADKK